eukprot:scaffold7354_cov59-Phaeocystis_antarctica.AAC.11
MVPLGGAVGYGGVEAARVLVPPLVARAVGDAVLRQLPLQRRRLGAQLGKALLLAHVGLLALGQPPRAAAAATTAAAARVPHRHPCILMLRSRAEGAEGVPSRGDARRRAAGRRGV